MLINTDDIIIIFREFLGELCLNCLLEQRYALVNNLH